MKNPLKKLKSSAIVRIFGLLAQGSTKASGERTAFKNIPEKAREAAAEGIVLLKNDANTLPFTENTVVSVFGRVQNDYFCVGYGSGGDVNAPYKINLMQGIAENERIKIHKKTSQIYREWCLDNPPSEGRWGHWPMNYPEMPVSNEMIDSASKESDAALIVLGRAAGEDRENLLIKGSYYLNDEEMQLLDKVTKAFDRVVLVLNCGNIIDCSFLERYGNKISAVVYAWLGGMESGRALCDVLWGAVTPSGKLTDSIAKTYSDYPSSTNFGGKKYNNYAEDIYVGYRYFSTFAPERVLFPFGFGLSYTTFSLSAIAFSVKNDTVHATFSVQNIGSVCGKQVIQLYCECPQGKLGKPRLGLCAFEKTPLLCPGGSCTVNLSVPLASIASYDDSGNTGHLHCMVLEEGDYRFYVGDSSASLTECGCAHIDATYSVKKLSPICTPERAFKRIIPVKSVEGYLKSYEMIPITDVSLHDKVIKNLPISTGYTGDKGYLLSHVAEGNITMDAFIAQLSVEELELLSHGDYAMNSPLGAKGNAGVFGGITKSLQEKGIPTVTTTDGPSGIRIAAYAGLLPCGTALASSWNPHLVNQLYDLIGKEMQLKGSHILLAPGMNIHRDPLCGRNFEYFSEDPVLSGKIASAVVSGIQKNGVSACPKHFACNNQETRRNRNDSRVSVRALREIYLKPFEICVKESSPLNLMTSYNKINGVWAHYNYDLCTAVLRNEWGYRGNVMTDWWMRPSRDTNFAHVKNNAYRIRAQVDVLMPGGKNIVSHHYDRTAQKSYERGGLTLGELQRTAKNVLSMLIKLQFPSTE